LVPPRRTPVFKVDVEAELRGDDQSITDGLKRLPDQFLVCERAVGFRSIEQRDATVVSRANQLDHFLPVGRWPVRGTHAHTAQTEGGHFKPAAA
jgi:hypothetical protein